MLTKRQQKRTMIRISISMIPLAVMIGLTLTQNLGVCRASTIEAEEFTIETPKAQETGQIRRESGMPCENREQFERWYETYECETAEETTDRPNESTATDETELETCSEGLSEEEDSAEVETDILDSQVPEVVSPSYSYPLYTINGELIDPVIQQKLHDALEKHGIAYWYEGALCQMYQESRGQQYAVNPNNGIDCGLFQYRSTYWNGGDIFDVDAQIERYASDMAARFNSGLSVDEAISRHNTSDYVTAVNWEYVNQVKQHLATMKGEN